jgi:aspartate/methionine/tyrosine aminotransferase
LGLQGLRTGWLICRDKNMVMDAIVLRENSSEIMNVMGEAIAEVALRPDRLSQALTKARRDSIATLEYLDAYIAAEPKLSWHRPEAGLIGLARLAEGIDSDIFANRLLADPFKTFLLPGSAYGLSNHIRLGVGGGASAKLDVGLTRMSQLMAEWGT